MSHVCLCVICCGGYVETTDIVADRETPQVFLLTNYRHSDGRSSERKQSPLPLAVIPATKVCCFIPGWAVSAAATYIEIYVDGIATMQIQNLNALVDTVRHEIIERYRPGEDDPHLNCLLYTSKRNFIVVCKGESNEA